MDLTIMRRRLSLLLLLFQGACAKPMVEERIVGGMDAQEGQWPWQVSLQINGFPICGGSLITGSWVLTAAHCFELPLNMSNYAVYLGLYQLSNLQSDNVVTTAVNKVIIHPNYNQGRSVGDIALVKLSKTVNFTSFILPVYLLSSNLQLPEGTPCWATGWGDIQQNVQLPSPQTLQEVEVALISNEKCESMYRSVYHYKPNIHLIQADMMCAGYEDGQKDSCRGDSGGPLVCNVNGTWFQAGIISWGFGCAEPNQPGVYTRVQYYESWLRGYVPAIYKKQYKKADEKLNLGNELALNSPSNRTFNVSDSKVEALRSGGPWNIHVYSIVNIMTLLGFMILLYCMIS